MSIGQFNTETLNINLLWTLFCFCFQICVSVDGHAGMCYEHSAAEGPPVAALCNHILDNL